MNSLARWQRPDLSVWPAFGKLFGLQDELNRFFDSPFTELNKVANLLSTWNPAIDIYEDKDNVIVKAELAGLKKEDIEVSLQDGALTISGVRKNEETFENAVTHRSERFVGQFSRTVSLASPVKADQINAQYTDGILTVTLPKAEEAKPKQVAVNVS
jgi:HSP20 family protein